MAALAALAIFAGSVSASAQAASGTVTGKVTDAGTGAPLTSVNVRVTGTQIGAQTTTDGSYTIRGVTPGTHDVQLNRIGYQAKHVSVTVAAGQTVTSNVQLTQAAFSLATVVTTVTGAQSKAEMTNSVATVDVSAKVDESSAQNLGQMLSGEAAGVQVSSSGAAGAGSRIRIRGQNSLSQGNDPVVYVDGIKVNSSAQQGRSSGTSRFDDIDPSEIESIDVLKGPSAATLYGTEAANGVILITTKKGKAGTTRINVFDENGISHDPSAGHYRDLWEGFDLKVRATGSKTGGQCTLVQEAGGSCHIDSLAHNNPLNQDATTPLQNGYSRDFGMQVSGGSTQTQYFVSGEYNNIMGTYKMPQSEIDRLTTERGQAPLDNQIYPNADRRINLRSNLSSQLGSKADLSASVGYLDRYDRQPPNEDNSQGLMVDAIAGTEATDQVDARGIPLNGYRTFPIGDILSQNRANYYSRYTTSLSARYYPLSWLNMRANVGYDYTGSHLTSGNYFAQGPCCGTGRAGSVSDTRSEDDIYTVDVGATATTGLWKSLGSKLSVGTQAYRNFSQSTGSRGTTLPPGATTPGQSAVETANNSTTESITLGNYVDEVVSYSDQFYLDLAARYDGNSAFGKGFSGVLYPKFGATWTMSQANWFPKTDMLSEFRIRFSDGTSGVQPGTNDATRYYSTSTLNYVGVDQPGVSLNKVGNINLKPEYSTEWETGFNATIFNNHTNLEVNYVHHKTRDALINEPLAPSLSGITSVKANLGSVKNTGFEYTLNNRIIDNTQVGLDVQLTGSTDHNTLITLGEGVTPVPGGTRNEELSAPGYPLWGYWGKNYTYNDANGDGILVPAEMTLGDTAIFIGASYPTIEMALNPRLELLHRKLAIAMQFDHKEGMIKYNNTLRHQCSPGGQSCQGLYNIASGLDWQAKAQADNTFSDYRGMYENGKFTRLREVSVSYQLADKLAAKVHASRALFVVTGRNLAVWTPFSGVDPESTVGNSDSSGNEEYFATPPLRQFTVRLNLTF
jgi:TonB-linked SusC/RagA family outer membrane protein